MYGQNAMSHNFLFTTYTLIIWLSILWHKSYKIKYVIWLAFICGVTILSRPSEVVCLIIPALWGMSNKNILSDRFNLFLKYKKQIGVFITILILIASLQMIYWKIHTGKYIFYSYSGNAGEGFEFFHPNIFNVLFSFRKGWLIYTPIMVFSIAGFYFIYKKNRPIFYSLFIYFLCNLYIVSSWSCWWYAQSFSQRSLIASYPIMAIGLGYLLTWLKEKSFLKVIGYTLMIGCILLNIFQTKQFYFCVLDGERMTQNYYFKIFGKMKVTEEDKKLLLIKRSFDGSETFTNEQEYTCKLLNKLDFENTDKRESTVSYSATHSYKLDSVNIYSPCIESPYYKITNKDHAWIRVSAFVYPTKELKTNPFSLVIHFNHRGYAYKYRAFDSENMKLELNKWNKICFDYLTPEVRNKKDNLKVYLWDRGKAVLYVDDLQVLVYQPK